ncbi:hypothetical protein WMY93_007785 [Mugilogobius chulae]|uniref:Roundabout, axon guidance receptor, homolog 3 (Drosophila) n=1 Tax=Mugilogobius chulae TaxID=88201 RepID=A0AAW0PPN4_9GOBI
MLEYLIYTLENGKKAEQTDPYPHVCLVRPPGLSICNRSAGALIKPHLSGPSAADYRGFVPELRCGEREKREWERSGVPGSLDQVTAVRLNLAWHGVQEISTSPLCPYDLLRDGTGSCAIRQIYLLTHTHTASFREGRHAILTTGEMSPGARSLTLRCDKFSTVAKSGLGQTRSLQASHHFDLPPVDRCCQYIILNYETILHSCNRRVCAAPETGMRSGKSPLAFSGKVLRDDFRQTPSDVVVAAGEPAVMECIPPRGHPEPTISWKRNNIKVNDRDERITIRGGKLMISNTRKSDAGMYVCVGTNMVGEKDSDPAELVVFERPVFIKQPVNQVVLADDTVDFFCEVHGDPTPTMRWRREEGELPRGSSGRTVTFLCGTKGNPPPAVFWQREGSQILLFPVQEAAPASRFSVSLTGELTIMDVQVEDSGYYICQAISVAGSILTKALLEVESAPSDRVPPIIRQGPANHTLAPGTTAQLHCHIMGNPLPSIQWEKDGQRILGNDGRISLMENGTFQITNLQETDSGLYTCVASSSSGETSWSGVLTVKESADSTGAQTTEPFQLPGPPHKPIVTDVSKNSVSLTWQPNAHEGGAAVTSYIIEAFSQSAGSTWQTVADNVKMETHTITGLLPNTIYLFIVRAVNAYGLSDPSPISEPVRTQEGIGEVAVQLQEPAMLSTSSVRVSWSVDRQSQYVQGYRLFYRPTGGNWLLQDINSPSERSTYEIKIRPYFDEFQGKDSRTVVVRTPEEGTANEMVWCVGSGSDNLTRYHINRTVDGNTLSVLLKGLVPGVLYQVEVAAVTSAGVGTRSQPVSVLFKLPAEHPSVSGDKSGTSESGEEGSVSLAEQITDVVKQPAFIAGIGGACWVILMGFSVWIYCRRKKRKELSHYTASFAYTPAVGFPHGEGSGLNGRPGVLGGGMGNYPWLADSWPTTNLVHSGKEAVNCCTANHNTAERYYNAWAAPRRAPSTAPSTPPARTCTASRTASSTPPPRPTPPPPSCPSAPDPGPAPASSSQRDTTPGEGHWIQPGPSSQYAQPDRCSVYGCNQQIFFFFHLHQNCSSKMQNLTHILIYLKQSKQKGKPKQKSIGKAVKTPSLTWMESLPPPPPLDDLDPCDPDDLPSEHEEMDLGSDEEWCPPLPERTYLMEGCEDASCTRNNASSPATSYSHQSTATLTPSPHEEPRLPHDLPRFNGPDSQQLARRRLPCSPVPAPPALSPSLTQSNPNLCGPAHLAMTEAGTLPCPSPAHRNFNSLGAGHNDDSSAASTPVHTRSPADSSTPPNQKSRVKKKSSKTSGYRRDLQGDLPPPPEPPPAEERLQSGVETSSLGNGALSSLERSEHSGSHQRKGSRQDDEIIPYGSKSGYLSRNQMSGNCSTTGSSSSRGSTGSRGPGSNRKHTEEMR